MRKFNIGDTVEWTSQSAGTPRMKRGEVIEVVPAFTYPKPGGAMANPGSPRNHESYIVRARAIHGGRLKGPYRRYWPLVKNLSAA